MNDNNVKSDLCLPVSFYLETLKKFDFAQQFLDDPNIFNSNSNTFRNFLIQAFAFIHPDFYSLSFLNKEIDQEIIRAAEILQILPIKAKKFNKLFDNFSNSEIKMFWSKLFSLLNCKTDYDFCIDISKTSQEKFDFFKNISNTLDYMHHELPVIKEKNLSNEFLNREIENWSSLNVKCSYTQEDSLVSHNSHQMESINIEQLLMDLQQVTSMLKNTEFKSNITKLEHEEFFNNFTLLTQNINQYIINLKEINSLFLDELYHKMLSEAKFIHSPSLYFLKRCNNFLKTLECSERFQSEYIEYLQNRNAELLNRLTQMKEIYDNKIFSKDLNQHYFISTLMDVLNVCTAVPEEIDTLFDKMSEAMSVLINILSRKSALIQLGEKISKLLSPTGNEDLIDAQNAKENNNSKTNRKAGTVKVSPMINGHIISTEPRIYLSRVTGNHIPVRSESHRLSPILEVSPDVTPDFPNLNNHKINELNVMSEKLNLNHATYNFINQESPKGRFKGTKIWKKSLSSNMQAQTKKDSLFLQNNEDLEKLNSMETGQSQLSENDVDPMEGPSWLYDDQRSRSSPKCFIDFRRRRHRYARVFDKDQNDIASFKTEESKADKICENISSGEPFYQSDNEADSKKLNSESPSSHLDSDQEYTPRTKKRKSPRKRRKCDTRENFDSDLAQKKTSFRRFSNKKEKEDSDISGSSYEGDNEENYSGKCKSARKPYRNNPFASEPRKSLPRVTLEELEFDCQESPNSLTRSNECLKPVPYDINFLIKEALGREAHIPIEDCMKGKKNSKPEKLSRTRSNARSRSNSKAKSPVTNSSNEKKLNKISFDSNLTNQNQRSRRKAAPTNLTEPKLGTKLRRS